MSSTTPDGARRRDGEIRKRATARRSAANPAARALPLDTVVLTAITSPTCSFDPQDGQNLTYQFALVAPTGSVAELSAVSGHPEEASLQFDLPGLYDVKLTVTDTDKLSAMATLPIPLTPQSDIEAVLTWPSALMRSRPGPASRSAASS